MRKKMILAVFLLPILSICIGLTSATAGRDGSLLEPTKINPSITWGTWDGWGTSICWMGNVFGDRDDLADLLFTTKTVSFEKKTLPGLGLNIVRYNAGACSNNVIGDWKDRLFGTTKKMAVSKTIKPYRQMDGFWLDGKSEDPQSQSWDWSVDAKQRAMLLKARDRGANWFELFSNSPMWWMCKNLNPSGATNGSDDNVAPEQYKNFAIYMATIACQAKDKWGITFTTVEPINEPLLGCWYSNGKQEGCHVRSEAQGSIIQVLRTEMDKRGLKDMPISASDESQYDMAVDTWNTFDANTKHAVKQINVHGYQGGQGRREFVYALAKQDEKRLWNSEYGDANPSGLALAANLNLDFRYLHPTAWCYWQPIDGNNWGFISTEMTSKTFQQVNPKYYVMAHYSRHIRQG
ncbi:TPA: beta-1,6-galactanase, partial [Candidatus Sumerlaeota bacterium]|nr:beta-1,6-galactanase [Candidatus Sumerlaeota bacterium]